jgi:hypothetical protein
MRKKKLAENRSLVFILIIFNNYAPALFTFSHDFSIIELSFFAKRFGSGIHDNSKLLFHFLSISESVKILILPYWNNALLIHSLECWITLIASLEIFIVFVLKNQSCLYDTNPSFVQISKFIS